MERCIVEVPEHEGDAITVVEFKGIIATAMVTPPRVSDTIAEPFELPDDERDLPWDCERPPKGNTESAEESQVRILWAFRNSAPIYYISYTAMLCLFAYAGGLAFVGILGGEYGPWNWILTLLGAGSLYSFARGVVIFCKWVCSAPRGEVIGNIVWGFLYILILAGMLGVLTLRGR